MEATKILSFDEVLEQNAVHVSEFLEGGEDRESVDVAAAKPHGEELVSLIQANWAGARKQQPAKPVEDLRKKFVEPLPAAPNPSALAKPLAKPKLAKPKPIIPPAPLPPSDADEF